MERYAARPRPAIKLEAGASRIGGGLRLSFAGDEHASTPQSTGRRLGIPSTDGSSGRSASASLQLGGALAAADTSAFFNSSHGTEASADLSADMAQLRVALADIRSEMERSTASSAAGSPPRGGAVETWAASTGTELRGAAFGAGGGDSELGRHSQPDRLRQWSSQHSPSPATLTSSSVRRGCGPRSRGR